MRRIGGHAGVWLAAGLWAVAAPVNIALIAATVAPPAHPDTAPPVPARPAPRDVRRSPTERGTPAPEANPDAGAPPPEAPPPPTVTRARLDSVVRTVIHEVAPGESLMSVTRGYLGSGGRWREVAEANGIAEPFVLETGASIRIPMAKTARTEARLSLVPPRKNAPDVAGPDAPEAPVKDMNPPETRTFEPLSDGLRIASPIAEAYPWEIPLFAGFAFVGVALGAAALAVAGAERRVDPARTLRVLWWGALAAGGAYALVAAGATLAACAIARSSVWQFALAAATGTAAGSAAWFAAKSTPGAGERGTPLHALAVRFGVALGWLAASVVAAASMAGWLPRALDALRLGA
jgi:hypothetical protein